MQITKSWLLNSSEAFWNRLIFTLHLASPYFGQLGWKFKPGFDPATSLMHKLEKDDLLSLRLPLHRMSNDTSNEEQVCRILMTTIFWVAPDYDRTEVIMPHDINEPKYPGYSILSAPQNYRPLRAEEIKEEDIKMFKLKIKLATSPHSEQLLEEFKSLKEYYQRKQHQLKQKLTNWTQLITNRHG